MTCDFSGRPTIPKNYWYTIRHDEIFIDLDSRNKLVPCLARLRGIIENQEIALKSAWLFPSPQNFHLILRVESDALYSSEQRTAFQLYLFSDVYRECCNLIRISKGHTFPNLLITPTDLRKQYGFYRFHDASCQCESKHTLEIMEDCPAAKLLRGENRCDVLFSKPIDPDNFFPKHFGKIYTGRFR